MSVKRQQRVKARPPEGKAATVTVQRLPLAQLKPHPPEKPHLPEKPYPPQHQLKKPKKRRNK